MRYENFGPVVNPDGSPTATTLEIFGITQKQFDDMANVDTKRIDLENAAEEAYLIEDDIDEAIELMSDYLSLMELDQAYDYLTEKYGDNEW